MCELACGNGLCINNVCVCPSDYQGLGEGINMNSCHLNENAIEILWYVTLGGCALVVAVSSFLLFRWVRGGGIDWEKLFTNRNFILLVGLCCIGLFAGLTAVVRLFAASLAFNDPAGTIIYFIAHCCMLTQCVPLIELCHDTLVGLLKALGCTGTIPERGKWTRPIALGMCIVPFIPILGSPALGTAGRSIMVQYYLVTLSLICGVFDLIICTYGEKAIAILKTVGTEPTIVPQRRIRLLLVNFYFNGGAVVICNLLFAFKYQLYYPYYIVGFCLLMPLACLAPVFGFTYDRDKITKAKAVPFPTKSVSKPTPNGENAENSSTKSTRDVDVQVETPRAVETPKAVDPPTKSEPDHMELA